MSNNLSSSPSLINYPVSFKYDLKHDTRKTLIKIKFLTGFFSTKYFPLTLNYLKENYPQVLNTLCFNYQSQPFTKEVTNTELGHLFEHLLIAKIYDLKVQGGERNFVVQGRTRWDWEKGERGDFDIVIVWDNKCMEVFNKAITETVILMEKIISTMSTKNSTGNFSVLPVEPVSA